MKRIDLKLNPLTLDINGLKDYKEVGFSYSSFAGKMMIFVCLMIAVYNQIYLLVTCDEDANARVFSHLLCVLSDCISVICLFSCFIVFPKKGIEFPGINCLLMFIMLIVQVEINLQAPDDEASIHY